MTIAGTSIDEGCGTGRVVDDRCHWKVYGHSCIMMSAECAYVVWWRFWWASRRSCLRYGAHCICLRDWCLWRRCCTSIWPGSTCMIIIITVIDSEWSLFLQILARCEGRDHFRRSTIVGERIGCFVDEWKCIVAWARSLDVFALLL